MLVVDCPELVRRQTVPLGPAAWRAIAVLVGMVVLLATGLVPPAIAGLIGGGRDGRHRVVTPQRVPGRLVADGRAHRRPHPAVGGDQLQRAPRTWSPAGGPGRRGCTRLLLAAMFVLTAALGQVVSNTATVLIVMPIAVAAARTRASRRTVLMLVAVAGAASFLSPSPRLRTHRHGPGGYRFGDYWKLGLMTTLCWFVLAVGLVPVIWPTG